MPNHQALLALQMIRQVFQEAIDHAPAIVVIESLDEVLQVSAVLGF